MLQHMYYNRARPKKRGCLDWLKVSALFDEELHYASWLLLMTANYDMHASKFSMHDHNRTTERDISDKIQLMQFALKLFT